MSNISTLTAWHRSQLGVVESPKGSNNVIYNTHFYGREVSGNSYPWCMAYIWDSFHQNGLSHLFCDGIKTAWCPYVAQFAKANNQWVTSGYREGDILLYDWDGDDIADHTGYCIGSNGSTATAIEGNASDDVSIQTRAVRYILGAYRPNYDVPATPTPEIKAETVKTETVVYTCLVSLPLLKEGSSGKAVKRWQIILKSHGYDLKDDEEFGPITKKCTILFQTAAHIEADGEVGPVTWNAGITK